MNTARNRSPLPRALATGLQVALVADAIWLLDSLLLKRYVADPAPVVFGCVLGFLIVLALRAVQRRGAPQHGPRAFWARREGSDLLLLAAFLVLFCVQNTDHMRASADGRAYFLQVRSLLIDWDVDFTEDAATFGVALAGADEDNPGGVTSYALGTPLAWTPFFALTHLWLGVHNLLGADHAMAGYFNAYQRGVGFGSLVWAFAGLLLLRRLLRRHHAPAIVDGGLLLTLFGTFLAWYAGVDATWSHALSMAATTAFVVVYELTRERRFAAVFEDQQGRWYAWALVGLAGGIMTMVRWQNILFFVLPAADLCVVAWRAGGVPIRWRRGTEAALATAAGALAGFFPQMLFWRLARSGWLDVPSGEHPIYWNAPYWLDALFGLDRGLVTWTPLAGLALVGLLFVPRGARRLAALLLLAFALQVYINGTVWWGGHGFGARRFANCVPVIALGMTAGLAALRRRPAIALAVAATPLLLLNLTFMREVTRSGLGQEGAVTFDRMMRTVAGRIGHPFALPAAAWFAYRFETDLDFYQRMGSRGYNNVRIDVGSSGDDRFLAGGWSGRETSGADTYRWATGHRSHVAFRTFEKVPYTLRFTAQPLRYADAPEQVVTVRVNGIEVWQRALAPGRQDYEVAIPEEAMRVHLNGLTFEYAYAHSPREVGLGDDERRLAVLFGKIELMRSDPR